MAEEHSGLSSDVHACPLLFRQAERLRGQSLPLTRLALTLQVLLTLWCIPTRCRRCCTTVRASLWVHGLIAPPKKPRTAAGSRSLVFPFMLSCCRFTLKIHMMNRSSVELVWVSTGSGLVLLAHLEPWINRGGLASVLPQVRHHAVGRALHRYLFPVVVL